MIERPCMFAAALLLSMAAAAAPQMLDLSLSDSKGGKPAKVFKPATPLLVLSGKLSGVADGTVLKADWIAEKTDVAPPGYRIDSKEVRTKSTSTAVTFTLSRPKAGWPAGSYRVDLFVDGKPAGKVPFTVEK